MKKKLIYINDVPEKYKKDKEYIKQVIQYYFDKLDFECVLKIEFVEKFEINKFEKTDCVLKNISIKHHRLSITNSALDTISCDGGGFFCIVLVHEFEHIKDYVRMLNTGLFKYNLSLCWYKNYEAVYMSQGFSFWTEVNSYIKTIQFAIENELNFEKITYGNLVNQYEKTKSVNKKLYNKSDLMYDETIEYIKTVNSFVYLCSKFMASAYVGHSKIPYAKIEKNKSYKRVYFILCGLEKKLMKLINNAYCPKSDEYLYKLGQYIWKDLKWKVFKVGLTKKKGRVCPFY